MFEENDIKRRWLKYVIELYDELNRSAAPLYFKKPLNGPTILKSEIQNVLSSMRNGKTLGSDKISAENIEESDHFGLDLLQFIANATYNEGVFLDELYKSTFITLSKKSGFVDYENFCTISLMSHVTKVILRVIMFRIRNKIHPEISTEQYGFMKNKETKNAIFVLRMLSERVIQIQQTIYLYFFDWKKEFDHVNHERLLQLLNKIGIDSKDLRLTQALC